MTNNGYHLEFDIDFERNKFPGKFIALEGIDGSGKTTHADLLVEALNKKGIKTIYTKEPTDHPTGQFIRKVLTGEEKLPSLALQYMYGADRAVHVEEIKEMLKKGVWVVTDRYFWSSVAYGISDLKTVSDYYLTVFSILSFYHMFLIPDVSFFLDVEIDTAMKRIDSSHKHRDIYDSREKLPKIKKGYDFLLEKFDKEFTIINGNNDIPTVQKELIDNLSLEKKV